jgi:pimeloyl-ACP methyl ester carboxylesterase
VLYGTSDVLVPAAHGAWLAATIPGAEAQVSELGHMGDPDEDLVGSLAWLTAAAP